jgi:hypothetical protein
MDVLLDIGMYFNKGVIVIMIFSVVWERMQRVYGIHYLKEKKAGELKIS